MARKRERLKAAFLKKHGKKPAAEKKPPAGELSPVLAEREASEPPPKKRSRLKLK